MSSGFSTRAMGSSIRPSNGTLRRRVIPRSGRLIAAFDWRVSRGTYVSRLLRLLMRIASQRALGSVSASIPGAFCVALALALALSTAEGQSPSVAIPQAMRAMTEGFGGCLGQITTRSVELSFFADVHFVRGKCALEHGDTTTALVGIDRDSVLYLASSVETLRFLVLRHPPKKLDSASAVAYAQQALEAAGLESGESTLLRSPEDVPAYARQAVTSAAAKAGTPLIFVTRLFPNTDRTWNVRMTFSKPSGYYKAAIVRHSFRLFTNGVIEGASSQVIWSDPEHQ